MCVCVFVLSSPKDISSPGLIYTCSSGHFAFSRRPLPIKLLSGTTRALWALELFYRSSASIPAVFLPSEPPDGLGSDRGKGHRDTDRYAEVFKRRCGYSQGPQKLSFSLSLSLPHTQLAYRPGLVFIQAK